MNDNALLEALDVKMSKQPWKKHGDFDICALPHDVFEKIGNTYYLTDKSDTALTNLVEQWLKDSESKTLAVVLPDTVMIPILGFGLLVQLLWKLLVGERNFALVVSDEKLRDIIHTTKLDLSIKIYASEADAVADLSSAN